MFTTQQVVRALRVTNNDGNVSEGRVRSVLRRGELVPPEIFAGRFAWTLGEVHHLARHLGLVAPSLRSLSRIPEPGSTAAAD